MIDTSNCVGIANHGETSVGQNGCRETDGEQETGVTLVVMSVIERMAGGLS